MKKIVFFNSFLLFIKNVIVQSEQLYNRSFDKMKIWVDKDIQTNFLLVPLFYSMERGNNLEVTVAGRQQLLYYINQKQKNTRIAQLIEVAGFISQQHPGLKH